MRLDRYGRDVTDLPGLWDETDVIIVSTMTPSRRLQIEQIANQYGPPNCWTGTTGTLAAIIRELLAEIDRIKNDAV